MKVAKLHMTSCISTAITLRIGYSVDNPEVGNPDPYQSSGLPTFITTLFLCCLFPLHLQQRLMLFKEKEALKLGICVLLCSDL